MTIQLVPLRMPASGLYAITDPDCPHLYQAVEQALQGGACLVQYRDKRSDSASRRAQALDLLQCCAAYQVPLIINDDVRLAAEIGAAGVHLGHTDMPLAQARQLLGPDAIIGISCYNQWHLAQQYATQADYIALGRFFSSKTKPQAVLADVALLQRAQHLPCPVVAIGGINQYNGDTLIAAGADLLAVVQGVFGAPDIRQAAQQITHLFV
ncbi:MAG: thiamine phosphate synthase [Pseudomonadota bacterium]